MATVSKGRVFVSGETVTPSKLNDLVDLATVTAIQTADIADGQITNAKVNASAAIAYSKLNLANSIVAGDIASDAVTTAKILNANVTPAKLSQPYTLATAQNSTSGTSIDFTGIPSWARRITVLMSEISTNATSDIIIRLGTAGGFEATGYSSVSGVTTNSPGASSDQSTVGFLISGTGAAAASAFSGASVFTLVSGNTWVHTGTLGTPSGARAQCNSGSKSLSGMLTQIRVTTVSGTATFDSGTINIAYE